MFGFRVGLPYRADPSFRNLWLDFRALLALLQGSVDVSEFTTFVEFQVAASS